MIGAAQGTVVAETLRKHRSEAQFKKQRNNEFAAAILEEMLRPNEQSQVELVDRLEKLDTIFQDAAGKKVFGFEHGMSEDQKEEKMVEGMIAKVKERLDRLDSYTKLFGISLFFVLFVVFLFMLRDVPTSHAIESSVLYSIVNKLPTDGSGGYFNSGVGATGVLPSEEDFYSFMSSTLLNLAFSDPVCGDGICEEPTEYAGFGRFGCIQDCGRFTQTTTITINLPTFAGSSPGGWDISGISRSADPGYRYNIYSATMGDFLFENDIDNTTVSAEVPDGKLELKFYQTKKLSLEVDESVLSEFFDIVPGTSPQRTATSDFAYGDQREFLASTIGLVKDVSSYCEGIGFYNEDANCNGFNVYDFAIKSMAGYGFSGTVATQSSSRTSTTLVQVSSCSVFPNGSLGVTDTNNKDRALAAKGEEPCSDSRRILLPHESAKLSPKRRRPFQEVRASGTIEAAGRREQESQLPHPAASIRGLAKLKERITADLPTSSRTLLQDFNQLIMDSLRSPIHFVDIWHTPEKPPSGYKQSFWTYVTAEVSPQFTDSGEDMGNFFVRWRPLVEPVFPTCDDETSGSRAAIGEPFVIHYDVSLFPEGAEDLAIIGILCNISSSPPSQVGTMQFGEIGELTQGPTISGAVSYPEVMYNSTTDYTTAANARLSSALLQTLGLAESHRVSITGIQNTNNRRLLGGVTVTFTAYAESNKQAGEWRNELLYQNTLQEKMKDQGAVGTVEVLSADINAPGKQQGLEEACDSHWDCEPNLFCANWGEDHSDGFRTCAWCSHCVHDSVDPVDKRCPQDLCPGSGGYPECIDAGMLLDGFTCDDSYAFEVWNYNTQGSAVDVKPEAVETVRTITPFNRIVGGILVTQSRSRLGNCSSHDVNKAVGTFTTNGGVKCPIESLDDSKFGLDPTFMGFSTLYNGKLQTKSFYAENEMASSSSAGNIPYGFFPHHYDPTTGNSKPANQTVEAEANKFKLFFDQRLTAAQAQKMLTFMKDGKFIDAQSDEIKIQFITYNAMHNHFALFTFLFDWQTSGNIKWDYHITALNIDVFQSNLALKGTLGFVLFVLLMVNCALEIADVMRSIRAFKLMSYLTDPFNWLDWAHFIVLWTTFGSVLDLGVKASEFVMQDSFPILESTQAEARFFKTINQNEFDFLNFLTEIEDLTTRLDSFFSLAGIAVVLFIFRLLKSLDFQPRMGLVTRTIGAAVVDLMHFFFLFGIVFIGYACVGNLVFGHLYAGMSTVPKSCLTLIIFLLSYDPTQFYSEMEHASSQFTFHLFLWSYIVVAFFILLNIFLAILVDAYARIKQEIAPDYPGLPDEVMDVLGERLRSLLPADMHLSDKQLLSALLHMRKEKRKGAVREQVSKHLEYRKVVLLPGGVEVTDYEMLKFARAALADAKGKKGAVAPEPDEKQNQEGHDDTSVPLDTLRGLMDRYAEDVRDKNDQRNKDILELVQVESLKRQLAVFKAQAHVMSSQDRLSNVLEMLVSGLLSPELIAQHDRKTQALEKKDTAESSETYLHVRVIEARGLPRMDLFRNCDPFCILFLDRGEHHQMFTTEVKAKSRNPVWNEEFDLMLDPKSSVLTCTLFDKDNLTRDDIMGVAHVPLRSLPLDQEVDKWYSVDNPALEKQLREASVHLALTRSHHPYKVDVNASESSVARSSVVEPVEVVRGEPVLSPLPLTHQASAKLDEIREAETEVEETQAAGFGRSSEPIELAQANHSFDGEPSIEDLVNDLEFEVTAQEPK